MWKKTIALVIAAGLAALVLPAASSANWKHHATDIQTDTVIGLTGNLRNQGSLGGVECQVTMRVKLSPGTTGLVETFVPHPTSDTTNCKGLGGLSPCQMHNLTPLAPNWTIHTASATTISLTTSDITYQLTGGIFCLVKHVVTTAGTLTLTPNQPNTISSFQVSGVLQADIQTNGGAVDKETVTMSGSLAIESPKANTYSL